MSFKGHVMLKTVTVLGLGLDMLLDYELALHHLAVDASFSQCDTHCVSPDNCQRCSSSLHAKVVTFTTYYRNCEFARVKNLLNSSPAGFHSVTNRALPNMQ